MSDYPLLDKLEAETPGFKVKPEYREAIEQRLRSCAAPKQDLGSMWVRWTTEGLEDASEPKYTQEQRNALLQDSVQRLVPAVAQLADAINAHDAITCTALGPEKTLKLYKFIASQPFRFGALLDRQMNFPSVEELLRQASERK